MNNLRLYGGRVPILTGDAAHPIQLVDFPTREVFASLYGKQVKGENIERYWQMLNARAKGATLVDAGRSQAITRERVRQIEAKFLRLMRQHHKKKQPS
jgi:ssDNA-specific exonuclease RecJ